MAVIMVGLYAVYWLNRKMEKWLGEKMSPIPFLNRYCTMSHLKWDWRFWMYQMLPEDTPRFRSI